MGVMHFIVTADDLEKAHRLSNSIDETIQHKIVTNNLAAIIAKNILGKDYDVDIESRISNISRIASEYELSDVYINGHCIDIRLCFDSQELHISKKSLQNGLIPCAYLFVRLSENLSEGDIQGIILPKDIIDDGLNTEYITIDSNSLRDYSELNDVVSVCESVNVTDTIDIQIYNFLDDKLSDTHEFFTDLLNSEEAREKLIKADRAETFFSKLSDENAKEQDSLNDTYANAYNNFNSDREDELNEAFTVNDEIAEENSDTTGFLFDEYSTETVPSLENIENSSNIQKIDVDNTIDTITEATKNDMTFSEENGVPIETLFNENEIEQIDNNISDNYIPNTNTVVSKQKNKLLPTLLIMLLIIAAGYYGYNSYFSKKSAINETDRTPIEQPEFASDSSKQEAMPDESIENTIAINDKETSESISIPAIEQNLNAPNFASNLSVDWNVPQAYITNAAARRYLTKIGKIIQLNLKTELLLVSKVPLSNKVTVELQFKKETQKFEVKEIKYSCGEKVIDSIIKDTVARILNMQQNQQMSEFETIQGNPILVIKF